MVLIQKRMQQSHATRRRLFSCDFTEHVVLNLVAAIVLNSVVANWLLRFFTRSACNDVTEHAMAPKDTGGGKVNASRTGVCQQLQILTPQIRTYARTHTRTHMCAHTHTRTYTNIEAFLLQSQNAADFQEVYTKLKRKPKYKPKKTQSRELVSNTQEIIIWPFSSQHTLCLFSGFLYLCLSLPRFRSLPLFYTLAFSLSLTNWLSLSLSYTLSLFLFYRLALSFCSARSLSLSLSYTGSPSLCYTPYFLYTRSAPKCEKYNVGLTSPVNTSKNVYLSTVEGSLLYCV